jgi:hypothetical protein
VGNIRKIYTFKKFGSRLLLIILLVGKIEIKTMRKQHAQGKFERSGSSL